MEPRRIQNALDHVIRMGQQKSHAWKIGDGIQVSNLDMAAWEFIRQFDVPGMDLRRLYESVGWEGVKT